MIKVVDRAADCSRPLSTLSLIKIDYKQSNIMADADSTSNAVDGLSLDPKQQKEFEKKLKNLPTKVSHNEAVVTRDSSQRYIAGWRRVACCSYSA